VFVQERLTLSWEPAKVMAMLHTNTYTYTHTHTHTRKSHSHRTNNTHCRNHLHRASSPSIRNKLSQLLQHAARGVHANPTAGPTALAVWVHGALSGGLQREEAARERVKSDVQVCVCVCVSRVVGALSGGLEREEAVRERVKSEVQMCECVCLCESCCVHYRGHYRGQYSELTLTSKVNDLVRLYDGCCVRLRVCVRVCLCVFVPLPQNI
jgi:hypothetical protein